MDTNPFDKFDVSSNPFDKFDAPSAGSPSTFKSGEAFKDTKDMLSNLGGIWEQLKSEWNNNKTLPELNAEAAKSPEAKARIEAQLKEGTQGAHAAGSAVLDTLGGLPAMAVGGAAGIGSGLLNLDASKGLETGGKVMTSLLPSSLLGSEEDQKHGVYKAAMAPVTAAADLFNAVPQGFGEITNAAGYPNAAQQVTDAGKLGIMAVLGAKGTMDLYKHVTGKEATNAADAAKRLEGLLKDQDKPKADEVQWDKTNSASDRGVAGQEPGAQGQLFSQEHDTPTAPIPGEAQGDLFNGMPPKFGDTTVAHADDFGAVNPYDVGGHVTASDQGHPSTIDNPQGELFGGTNLQDAQAGPRVGPDESLLNNRIPRPPEVNPNVGTRDAAKAKALEELKATQAAATAPVDKGAVFDRAEKDAAAAKERDLNLMQAQKEMDFADTASSVEQTPGRNFFTDKDNRDKVVRPEDSPARSFFLDPANRDKVDFHADHSFAHEELGDKSLMDHGPTGEMVDALHAGDVNGALDSISRNHPNVLYRKLADYLKGKLDGLQIKMHDEGILQMGDRHATGYYDPTTHTVGLSKVGAVSPHTVLHELVHAMTSDFINNRMNDMRVLGLKDLFNKLNEHGMAEKFPNVGNVKEFVAEAFSNPEFQDFLKQFRVNTRTAWGRFVDNVKSMLGLSANDRNHLTDALDHVLDLGKQVMDADKSSDRAQMTDAGVPNKLADLMVTRKPEKTNVVMRNENMKAVRGLGKIEAQFDFTPLKPEEVIPMAKEAADIPASTLETIKANLDAGGRFASLRHNNNPVIKYTFAYVDHAVKAYEKWTKDNITNSKTGIKAVLRDLSGADFTAVHQLMMLDEGVRERTPLQLRELGWSEKMIEAHQRIRAVDMEMLAKVNEVRAQMNPPLPPIERRIGHLAGRFLGDFYHTVYELNADGTRKRAVMMITDSTRRGAQKLADFMAQEHPDWEISKQEYNNIKKSQNSDRFSGFMELMNFIGKHDKEVARALDSLDKYNRRAATNYLNTLRHAKDKVRQPGGVLGSEGNKPYESTWGGFGDVQFKDLQKNAEEGFKGHLAYLDTSAKWVEMQKAMENISKVVTDPEVIKAQPNAIKWSTAYTDHALHRNQGFLTDLAQSLLSETGRVTGVGHTNITKGVNWMSTAEMRNWMGIGNIPFALKHMVLPFQKMPAMLAYLKTVGDVEASIPMAGLRSLSSYYHYLKDAPTTPFEKQAFQYAKDNNVFNVNLDNLSGRIQAGKVKQVLGKVADADFSMPEHAIRGTSFFFYAHLLEKAGMDAKSSLSAAEHLSKFLYTDYAPHEAPRAAAKAGWIGQLAFQVTRYKANELGQLGFFNRERMSGEDHTFMQKMTSNLPLMTHVGSLLAFSGVTGMIAYKEMDEAYSLFRKYVMNDPDNLTALLQRSKAPELVKYGMSSLLGIDSKISEAQLLPSPFPTTAAEINQMGLAFNAARYHDKFHTQQLALSLTPSTFRGPVENKVFTQPQETTGPHAGKSLYLNPNTGEGRVWRTPEQMATRNLGFHTTAETNETENSYAISRIEGDHRDLAEHVLEKAKGMIASNSASPQALQALAQEYAKHQQAGQIDFASALQSYAMGRHMSQREQMEMKAANDRGMANSMSIMQRNK